MAFKSSCHLQLCRLPKLDAGGASVWDRDDKWPLSLPTTCSRAGYLSWTLGGVSWGSRPQIAFKFSYHLQPCQFPKLEERQFGVMTTNQLQVLLPLVTIPVIQAGHWRGISWGHDYKWPSSPSTTCSSAGYPSWTLGALVRSRNYKWPSSPPTTCGRAGYPSWMMEEHQLGVTTTDSLQIFLPPVAVSVT